MSSKNIRKWCQTGEYDNATLKPGGEWGLVRARANTSRADTAYEMALMVRWIQGAPKTLCGGSVQSRGRRHVIHQQRQASSLNWITRPAFHATTKCCLPHCQYCMNTFSITYSLIGKAKNPCIKQRGTMKMT